MESDLPPALATLWLHFAAVGATWGLYAWYRGQNIGLAIIAATAIALGMLLLNSSLASAASGLLGHQPNDRSLFMNLLRGAAAVIYLYGVIFPRVLLAPIICVLAYALLSYFVPAGLGVALREQSIGTVAYRTLFRLFCLLSMLAVAIAQFVIFYKNRAT